MMDNETDNAKSESEQETMTQDDFQEFGEGVAKGIDLLIDSQPGKFNYVLCIHHVELEEMGVILNVPPEEGLNMIKSVNARMDHELNKTRATKDKGIILPH